MGLSDTAYEGTDMHRVRQEWKRTLALLADDGSGERVDEGDMWTEVKALEPSVLGCVLDRMLKRKNQKDSEPLA